MKQNMKTVSKKNNKKNKYNKTSKKEKKAGFSFFGNPSPKTTEQIRQEISEQFGAVKMKNMEEEIKKEIENAKDFKGKCSVDCIKNLCEKDEETCQQINNMMNEKNDYDWANTCKNLEIENCKGYLSSITKIQFFANQLKLLNEKVQDLYSEFDQSTKRNSMPRNYTPITEYVNESVENM